MLNVSIIHPDTNLLANMSTFVITDSDRFTTGMDLLFTTVNKEQHNVIIQGEILKMKREFNFKVNIISNQGNNLKTNKKTKPGINVLVNNPTYFMHFKLIMRHLVRIDLITKVIGSETRRLRDVPWKCIIPNTHLFILFFKNVFALQDVGDHGSWLILFLKFIIIDNCYGTLGMMAEWFSVIISMNLN